MDIDFRLDKMTVRCTSGDVVVSGSVDYLRANFKLVSNDWQPPITALFNDVAVILDDNNSCIIPWEVTQNAGTVSVSAYCGDVNNDNYLHTANCATFTVDPSCYKQGETPKPPTPDVYQAILNKAQNAENVAQSVRDDADAGLFDGADGKDGTDGLNGKDGANGTTYTPHVEPVKGGNALSWTNDGGKPNPETVTIKDGESVYCDNQPKHTATGELIALDDVYPAQPLSLGVEGKTSENLWQNTPNRVAGDLTFTTQDDGSVVVKGKPSAASVYTFSVIELVSNKTYSFSCAGAVGKSIDDKGSVYAIVEYTDTDANVRYYQTAYQDKNVTFTTPKNVSNCRCTVSIGREIETVRNTTLYPMLVEGSKPQPWTPTGLTCVESAEIEVAGKNLIKRPYSQEDGIYDNLTYITLDDGRIKIDGIGSKQSVFYLARKGDIVDTKTEVTLSCFPAQYGVTAEAHIICRDGSQQWKRTDTSSGTVTFNGEVLSIYLVVEGHHSLTQEFSVQLETGSVATPYETYKQMVVLPIDLQSNKLCCSKGSRKKCDELRITREGERGHVELVKRTFCVTGDKNSPWVSGGQTSAGAYRYYFDTDVFAASFDIGEQYTYPLNHFNQWGNAPINTCYLAADRFWVFVADKTQEEFLANIPEGGYTIIGNLLVPQTIDLGYIDLPTLPAPNATVWTSSNLPVVTSSVEYVQDINVVLSKLMQAIVAVPAMI